MLPNPFPWYIYTHSKNSTIEHRTPVKYLPLKLEKGHILYNIY